jgi:hypothetical protein
MVRDMKPFAILAVWAFLGWDAGAWAEAFVGIPAFIGILGGVAIGALLAVEVRRRSDAAAARAPQVAGPASAFESSSGLDRAA